MFNYPGTEVYNPQGAYRVVWSVEEYEQALADGWLAENPVPLTSIVREVIAESATEKPKRGRKAVIPTEPEAA